MLNLKTWPKNRFSQCVSWGWLGRTLARDFLLAHLHILLCKHASVAQHMPKKTFSYHASLLYYIHFSSSHPSSCFTSSCQSHHIFVHLSLSTCLSIFLCNKFQVSFFTYWGTQPKGKVSNSEDQFFKSPGKDMHDLSYGHVFTVLTFTKMQVSFINQIYASNMWESNFFYYKEYLL